MRALIITDVQRDFCEGGALAIEGGELTARMISMYLNAAGEGWYDYVIATQDWHVNPGEHFETWPVHCMAGEQGAELHPLLDTRFIDAIVRKGQYGDGYSAFDAITAADLKARGISGVDVCGLATDYCVQATATDAYVRGFTTRVLPDLCEGTSDERTEAAFKDMHDLGIVIADV